MLKRTSAQVENGAAPTDPANTSLIGEGRAPSEPHGVMKAPCKSCPYRRDVPSGLWHREEYEKLPGYDGEIIDQLLSGAGSLFLCHQQDNNLCAGWLACHGSDNLLALRMHSSQVKEEVWGYESPVPVFSSGQEAHDHGVADIDAPGAKASRVIQRLHTKAQARERTKTLPHKRASTKASAKTDDA